MSHIVLTDQDLTKRIQEETNFYRRLSEEYRKPLTIGLALDKFARAACPFRTCDTHRWVWFWAGAGCPVCQHPGNPERWPPPPGATWIV